MTIASVTRRLAVLAAGLALAAGAQAQWQPSKPITIIVPWSAGGSTDQVTRVTAGELEKALGQKVVIVNQPGASGSIGTKNAWEAPRDGYTWTAGAAQDLGVYRALGMLDTNLSDWHLFLSVANVAVIGVNAASPYKSVGDLIAAMKASPGKISVATAGVTSAGHNAMEAVARATGVTYRHVTYDGGNPAVVATVAGETEVTTQLAVEQAEMIRAKRIRPLATVSDKSIDIEGYGTIEPITKSVRAQRADQLLRRLRAEGRARRGGADGGEGLGLCHRAERRAEKVRGEPRRLLRPAVGRGRAQGRLPGGAGERLAAACGRQDQGGARHGRHPQAVAA